MASYPAVLGCLAAVTVTTLSGCGSEPATADCLCIFDIDRTLTGQQNSQAVCPDDEVFPDINDQGYAEPDGAPLSLSVLGQQLDQTFCNECYIGTISAGVASGPNSDLRAELFKELSKGKFGDQLAHASTPDKWLEGCNVNVAVEEQQKTPLLLSCADGTKQSAVPGIIEYYKFWTGVTISDDKVHFFDDRISNVQPFIDDDLIKYNAHQISCNPRDSTHDKVGESGAVGMCGATLDEMAVVGDRYLSGTFGSTKCSTPSSGPSVVTFV